MAEFKVGQTVYAVKAKDDGTDVTDHRFGYNESMDHFAQGNVKGVIIGIEDDEVYVDTGHGTWSYATQELRKTPRTRVRTTITKAAIRTNKVLAKAPKKVYAVVKGDSVYPTETRAAARGLKLILGGKAKGAIIVRYDITAEIR